MRTIPRCANKRQLVRSLSLPSCHGLAVSALRLMLPKCYRKVTRLNVPGAVLTGIYVNVWHFSGCCAAHPARETHNAWKWLHVIRIAFKVNFFLGQHKNPVENPVEKWPSWVDNAEAECLSGGYPVRITRLMRIIFVPLWITPYLSTLQGGTYPHFAPPPSIHHNIFTNCS